MREQSPQPDLDGYTKNGFYGRVQDQILKLEAQGRKARAESFIVISRQGIWRRMGRRTFYRLFGLHYISEEDDPVTKGIQAAINRAHSKIFIKDGTYLLAKNVQYPTSPPGAPSALWYDFPKAIILEGESNDAVIQLYGNNGVSLFQFDDYFVNKPYLVLKSLQIQGVGTSATNAQGQVQGFALGGQKGGYFFLWDITLTNVQAQSIFGTDFISIRNMRIFNTLQNTGPVANPGGINVSQNTQGEIDGYYVYGYADNALTFNFSPGWFNASHIHIFRGGLTQVAYAILFAGPNNATIPFNVNLDDVVTDGQIAIAPNFTGQNINIGKLQLLPGNSGLSVGSATDVNIQSIISQNAYISVFGSVDRFSVGEFDLTWNNPNSIVNIVAFGGSSTGKIRFGRIKANIASQPSGGTSALLFVQSGSTATVDIDELSVNVAAGSFLINPQAAPGSRIGRARINGLLQTFPPDILVNPPVSGTTYQNTNLYGIVLLIPVALTPTSTAAASASIAVGTSPSSLSTVQTLTQAAGAGPVGGVLQAAVPSGQYYQITLTNATAYQAIVLPE